MRKLIILLCISAAIIGLAINLYSKRILVYENIESLSYWADGDYGYNESLPQWSSDGTSIFCHTESGRILRYDIADRTLNKLKRPAVSSWWNPSPDKKKIVMLEGTRVLQIADLKTGAKTKLYKASDDISYVSWLAQGSILFVQGKNVFAIESDGARLRKVKSGVGDIELFSFDGNSFIYMQQQEEYNNRKYYLYDMEKKTDRLLNIPLQHETWVEFVYLSRYKAIYYFHNKKFTALELATMKSKEFNMPTPGDGCACGWGPLRISPDLTKYWFETPHDGLTIASIPGKTSRLLKLFH